MKPIVSYLRPLCSGLGLSLLFSVIVQAQSSRVVSEQNPALAYKAYEPGKTDQIINRQEYYEKLRGFWLGTCIANWTGLVTEMDKIGNIGDLKTGNFYTRQDWGKADQPSIWGKGIPSNLSPTIDFVMAKPDNI